MSQSNLAIVSLAIVAVCCVNSSPLDDYVNAPDPHFSYRYITTYNAPGYAVHALNMTSQKWLSEDVSSNPIWTHQVFIVVPVKIVYPDTAFMFIGSGSNTDPLSALSNTEVSRITYIAQATGSVAALIKQIPNQPIVFPDDLTQAKRSEDAIMAWTWKKYLANTSNPDIIVLLPMTKAVVRGLDLVSSYVNGLNGNLIDKFVVSGRSKRGWTTWLTAAVDKRVIAIAPTVMDLLNLQKNLHHHFRSLEGWTFAFSDYYQANITHQLDSPNFQLFQDIVDPLAYNARYTKIPKLIITSAGDEFFLLDDSHYYYDLLQGPKYLRIFPNATHSVGTGELDYEQALANFYLNVLEKAQFPTVTWGLRQTGYGGKISAKTSQKPIDVTVFYAETADDTRRDFRINILDPLKHSLKTSQVSWYPLDANKISDLEYEADVKRPVVGWAAFYIQLTFQGVHNSTLTFTTEVNIIPDVFTIPDCSGDTCFGTLK